MQPELATPEAPLGGYLLAQLIIGVLGALLVTSEYTSGMIRATFAAVPPRQPVLVAKTIVFALAGLTTMTLTTFVAFFAAQLIIGGDEAASIGDPGVLRSVVGVGIYLTFAGLLGSALGWILRNTAGAMGTLTGLLLVLPSLALLLPTSVQETVKLLPSNAGEAIITTAPEPTLLGPWAGLRVLSIWIIGCSASRRAPSSSRRLTSARDRHALERVQLLVDQGGRSSSPARRSGATWASRACPSRPETPLSTSGGWPASRRSTAPLTPRRASYRRPASVTGACLLRPRSAGR